ncbi:hypothetical protein [Microvirga subterranea]|nr:hypothetical protein [Microvirga subterranea]
MSTMTDQETRVTFSDADFDAIEAAVMETERGRWFLREYARRNRNADTEAVLAELRRFEEAARDDETARRLARIQESLRAMATTIARTKGEVGLLPRHRGQDDLGDFLTNGAPESEEEFEAWAEHRIRRIIQTLRYVEGRVQEMVAVSAPEQQAPADERSSFPETRPVTEEATVHPGPHPSFLM